MISLYIVPVPELHADSNLLFVRTVYAYDLYTCIPYGAKILKRQSVHCFSYRIANVFSLVFRSYLMTIEINYESFPRKPFTYSGQLSHNTLYIVMYKQLLYGKKH